MNWSVKLPSGPREARALLLATAVFSAAPPVLAQTPDVPPAERLQKPVAPDEKPGLDSKSQTQGGPPPAVSQPAPLSVPFIEGSESLGIRIPDMDSATGKMRSLLIIGALSRLDDRLLQINESYFQTYQKDGSPEFSINFPKATLDRFTRKLKSTQAVAIWTENFSMQGDAVELDTVSREAIFEGPVRMVIYQLKGSFPDARNGAGAGETLKNNVTNPVSADESGGPENRGSSN